MIEDFLITWVSKIKNICYFCSNQFFATGKRRFCSSSCLINSLLGPILIFIGLFVTAVFLSANTVFTEIPLISDLKNDLVFIFILLPFISLGLIAFGINRILILKKGQMIAKHGVYYINYCVNLK